MCALWDDVWVSSKQGFSYCFGEALCRRSPAEGPPFPLYFDGASLDDDMAAFSAVLPVGGRVRRGQQAPHLLHPMYACARLLCFAWAYISCDVFLAAAASLPVCAMLLVPCLFRLSLRVLDESSTNKISPAIPLDMDGWVNQVKFDV